MTPDTISHTVHWDRLGLRVRLALRPDDPRLITDYLRCGEQLIARHGQAPWQVHDRMLSVLLGTAYDALLPIAWRITCLDTCTRPLSALGALVHDDVSARRFRHQARRLASFSYNPVNSDPTA